MPDYRTIELMSCISELGYRLNSLSCEAGWWNEGRSLPEALADVAVALAQASQEYARTGEANVYAIDEDFQPHGAMVKIGEAIFKLLEFSGSIRCDIAAGLELYTKYLEYQTYGTEPDY